MKKNQYIHPEVLITKIQAANLCSISTGSADLYDTTWGASDALSRENDWDDEEDY